MSTNDITGDKIATKTVSDAYRDNYDTIFKPKDTFPVYYWADGTWCTSNELEEMLTWKSDDYGKLDVIVGSGEHDVDKMIDALVNR